MSRPRPEGGGIRTEAPVTRPGTDDDVAALFARREAPIADLAGQAGAVSEA